MPKIKQLALWVTNSLTNVSVLLMAAFISLSSANAHAGIERFCEAIFDKPSVSFRDKIAYYNPFNLFAGKTVKSIELLGEDFYRPDPAGSVVGVSGYAGFRSDYNRANGDFLSGKPFVDERNGVFNYDVKDVKDLFFSLLSAYSRRGPIKKLAIVGHGAPGGIEIGDEFLSEAWIETHRDFLNRAIPKDLFAEDAEIVLLSCAVTEGTRKSPGHAVSSIQKIFGSFVHRGAHVIASRKDVWISTDGFAVNDVVERTETETSQRTIGIKGVLIHGLALAYLPVLWTTNFRTSLRVDAKSKFDPIDVISIEPKQRANQ